MKDQDGHEYKSLDQMTDEELASSDYDAPGRLITVECECGATSQSFLIWGASENRCEKCERSYELSSPRVTVSEYRSYRIVP
jgi:hypothetical protein